MCIAGLTCIALLQVGYIAFTSCKCNSTAGFQNDCSRWHQMHVALMQELALDAVTTVMSEAGSGQREIDIKKYVKIEKIPGGAIEDCR